MGEKVTLAGQSPADAGFRMPAEWEPHEATWLGWPHNKTDWPGKFAPIPWVYAEMVRMICAEEIVRLLVNSQSHTAHVRRILSRVGVDLSRIEFLHFPTDRGWTRDSGPIFVKRSGEHPGVSIARFRFNAWVKYPDWKKDVKIPERAAHKCKRPLIDVRHNSRAVVLEGGSIDVNGLGTLLATEECLLDEKVQVRNPGSSRSDYEDIFRKYLGVTNTLWLGKGIAGDDTHGHVDDLCRFVGPRTIVLCQEEDPTDSNYQILRENRERLQWMKLEDGSSPEIAYLPMPSPLYFNGQRLPASYANFYICNAAVLVPTFNDPKDRTALGILSELITDRPVVGIHAVDLVWGLGTIHCLTQQEPAT